MCALNGDYIALNWHPDGCSVVCHAYAWMRATFVQYARSHFTDSPRNVETQHPDWKLPPYGTLLGVCVYQWTFGPVSVHPLTLFIYLFIFQPYFSFSYIFSSFNFSYSGNSLSEKDISESVTPRWIIIINSNKSIIFNKNLTYHFICEIYSQIG